MTTIDTRVLDHSERPMIGEANSLSSRARHGNTPPHAISRSG